MCILLWIHEICMHAMRILEDRGGNCESNIEEEGHLPSFDAKTRE